MNKAIVVAIGAVAVSVLVWSLSSSDKAGAHVDRKRETQRTAKITPQARPPSRTPSAQPDPQLPQLPEQWDEGDEAPRPPCDDCPSRPPPSSGPRTATATAETGDVIAQVENVRAEVRRAAASACAISEEGRIQLRYVVHVAKGSATASRVEQIAADVNPKLRDCIVSAIQNGHWTSKASDGVFPIVDDMQVAQLR